MAVTFAAGHALILAGGEGSRMAADGIAEPKALVPLAGRAQLVRLMETFLALGCETVTCMLRDDVPAGTVPPWAALPTDRVHVHRCHTPSSLHTLVAGLRLVPPGPVLCSMVDTVMPAAEWVRVTREMLGALADGADGALLTTPYVDDEHPLYVSQTPDSRVVGVGATPSVPVRVTGGVYAFAPGARTLAFEALSLGAGRMREFLALLALRGQVVAVETDKVIDLDRGSDLAAATAWLSTLENAITPGMP
jgi:CTP:molybdopterin cytidylyltransferase MocA